MSENNYREVSIENWNRKSAFEFYSAYADPFFEVTGPLDFTELYNYCKQNKQSLFLHYLHAALLAANRIPEFKYRFQGKTVVEFDQIYGGSTILKADKSFAFCYFDYYEDAELFCKHAADKLETQKKVDWFEPASDQIDMIHFSTMPWISFTSMKHARNNDPRNAIPKIVFGKYYDDSKGGKLIPLSVEVNHCLMDGYHVGLFFQEVENIFRSYGSRSNS